MHYLLLVPLVVGLLIKQQSFFQVHKGIWDTELKLRVFGKKNSLATFYIIGEDSTLYRKVTLKLFKRKSYITLDSLGHLPKGNYEIRMVTNRDVFYKEAFHKP